MVLLDKIVAYYGITYNFNEAGFILPDGSLLDFSGRHLSDDYVQRFLDKKWVLTDINKVDTFLGKKNVNHNDIERFYPEFSGNFPHYSFMWEYKAIRKAGRDGFQLCRPPTDEQETALFRYITTFGPPMIIEYIDAFDHETEYSNIAKSRAELVDILVDSSYLYYNPTDARKVTEPSKPRY